MENTFPNTEYLATDNDEYFNYALLAEQTGFAQMII